MTSFRAVLAGHLGPLARATADGLKRRDISIVELEHPHVPDSVAQEGPLRMICFPFSPALDRRTTQRTAADLSYLEAALGWAERSGVVRVVLRSHAVAYGVNMKNPGLLEEGRISLLPKDSMERRWLEAERLLFKMSGQGVELETGRESVEEVPLEPGGFSAAALRLVTVLDAKEADPLVSLLLSRACTPLAGYDPQLQWISLHDAAEALAAALCSNATGIFNVAPDDTVSAKDSLRAAVSWRLPVSGAIQKPIRSMLWKAGVARFPGEAMDRLKYNWTVSGQRASRELGFRTRVGSSAALREFLSGAGRNSDRLRSQYDEFGLDPDYIEKWNAWFYFLRKIYWRAEVEGLEHIPSSGPAVLVANHRGFMPFDGVVHRATILEAAKRHIRFLVIPSLFKFPFLSDFLIKQGGVVASQENTRKLFRRGELVGIFPEGISGAFRMYRGAYQLGDLGKNAFAKLAIENRVPLIPSATIGHVEIFPILVRINSSLVTRSTGWPFLPLTPTFPLLPLPLPTKWHIRYIEPVPVDSYRPEDAQDPRKVAELAEHVRAIMQNNIDEMLNRRRHIFFGNIFKRPTQPQSSAAGS